MIHLRNMHIVNFINISKINMFAIGMSALIKNEEFYFFFLMERVCLRP